MHDVVFFQYFEGLDDLLEVGERGCFWQYSFFSEKCFEGASVAVLVDKVEVIDCFEHVVVLDNVGTAFKIVEDVDLIVGAFLQFGVLFEFVSLDHFDCDFLLSFYVYGAEHCRVHSSANLVQ